MRLFTAFCDSLISLLITELQLLRVCNPLARSAGVFLKLYDTLSTSINEFFMTLTRLFTTFFMTFHEFSRVLATFRDFSPVFVTLQFYHLINNVFQKHPPFPGEKKRDFCVRFIQTNSRKIAKTRQKLRKLAKTRNVNFGRAWAGYGCRKCFESAVKREIRRSVNHG